MTPPFRAALWSLVTCAFALTLLDLGYGWYVRRRFVPERTLAEARAAGDGCVVAIGDSRMAAGLDARVLARSLPAPGGCVAALGIGALTLSGQTQVLRRYVETPRRPRFIVLGVSDGGLLPNIEAADPAKMIGNQSLDLAWSRASDVFLHYPDFPLSDFDRGFRYSLNRSSALLSYASLTWARVQQLQQRLTGDADTGPSNRFGAVSDMVALAHGFRSTASQSLAHWDGKWRVNRWFEAIYGMAREQGARLVVVDMPMPESYRRGLRDTSLGRRYAGWMQVELARRAVLYVDLSDSAQDASFSDGIHLSADGARAFSEALARALDARVVPR